MIRKGFRQDDTWLAIDPIVGCGLNCQYCFLQTYGKAKTKPEVTMSPEETLSRLLSFKTYRKGVPLMLGSETDLFMSRQNISYLTNLLELFEENKIPNPVAVVTKCHIPDEFILRVKQFQSTKLFFYLSYSGLPKEIEPAVDVPKLRANFQRLASAQLNVIHYWRPLMPLNSDLKTMESIADFVSQYARCSVVSGLKLNSDLREYYWFWPELREAEIDFQKVSSVWQQQAIDNLRRITSVYPKHPIYFVNSCGLAYASGIPEFNSIYNSKLCLKNSCPAHQRRTCMSSVSNLPIPTVQQMEDAMGKIGMSGEFEINEKSGEIWLKGVAEHGDLVYLTQILKHKVNAVTVNSDHEWGGPVIGREFLILQSEA